MAKNINPSRLIYRIQFGSIEPNVPDDNGIYHEEFVTGREVWAGLYHLTQNQRYTLAGQDVSQSIAYFVRHDMGLMNYSHVRVDKTVYQVIDYAPDSDNAHNSFDVVTLKAVKKRG
ncbi:phage head closure protein [Lactobacillus selangorensis]|nr:phage head closure protein [Lactobacillus selangorensis]